MTTGQRFENSADWSQAIALADALIRQGQGGAVLAFDGECRYVYWSSKMEQITGLPAAAVVGRSAFEVFPFLRAIGEDSCFRAALAGQTTTSRDRPFMVPETGSEGLFDAHYVPLHAPDGSVIGGAALIADTSERRRAEARVRETEERFRNMADASPVLLWMSRADGLCTFFNQTWIEFTGRTQEQEWGIGWAEGVHFEDLQSCIDTYMEAFSRRRVLEMEYRLRRNDGEYRWILDRGTPRYLPDGTFAGYIGSCIDITDRKRAEIELHRDVHAKDEFLGLISHELRTPVTALQLQIECLRRLGVGSLAERERDLVARIGTTTDRLAHMVEAVLQVCRIESGKLRLEPVEFDLAALTESLTDEQRPAAERKGLRLMVRLDGALPPLYSDPEIVRLIVSNLVSNAIKFTESGSVEVTLHNTGSAHRIAVRDTGPGIPRDEHRRIFGVFEQYRSTGDRHAPGVGLGLSLVKSMTSSLGGLVTIESDLGRGSLFTVDLPPLARAGC